MNLFPYFVHFLTDPGEIEYYKLQISCRLAATIVVEDSSSDSHNLRGAVI
jgi:hypothetical protein